MNCIDAGKKGGEEIGQIWYVLKGDFRGFQKLQHKSEVRNLTYLISWQLL